MKKRRLRARIADLERRLALADPPSFITARINLGATGGRANAIDWPIEVGPQRRNPVIDLPSLGYIVTAVASEPDHDPTSAT